MADLRLTHDPESGCGGCVFLGDMLDHCDATERHLPDAWKRYAPAPDWCPLRSGTVTVSPPDADPSEEA